MRVWKLLGVAGLVGVAATGYVLVRRRRAWRHYDGDELRDRLRGRLAATQNRLDRTRDNIGIMTEQMTAAESRIRDVDVAEETAAMARNQVLQQAAIAILAQANTTPQIALQLLQN